jgi:iron-sulfur cluster repair protein YtfE (RIC family)
MQIITGELRDERQHLGAHVGELAIVGDVVGHVTLETLRAAVEEVYHFLSTTLMPHLMADQLVLYPVVARLMGAPEATATMEYRQRVIQQLVDQLDALRWRMAGGPLDRETQAWLRSVLYGLHALLKTHLVSEEALYLPLLERELPDTERRALEAQRAGVEDTLTQHAQL